MLKAMINFISCLILLIPLFYFESESNDSSVFDNNQDNYYFADSILTNPTPSGNKEIILEDKVDSSKILTNHAKKPKKRSDADEINNLISINLMKVISFYNISYFNKLDENIMIGGEFLLPSEPNVNGLGIGLECRYHFAGLAPKRMYLAGRIGYYDLKSLTDKMQVFSFSAIIGWQAFLGEHFNIGLAFGLEYFTNSELADQSLMNTDKSQSTILPLPRLELGWAF